jgi:hypothetical protein
MLQVALAIEEGDPDRHCSFCSISEERGGSGCSISEERGGSGAYESSYKDRFADGVERHSAPSSFHHERLQPLVMPWRALRQRARARDRRDAVAPRSGQAAG